MTSNTAIRESGTSGEVPTQGQNTMQHSCDDSNRTLPLDKVRALYAPLPPEAITPHPTKAYLSSIKAIYVIERLNEVFGMGGWTHMIRIVEKGTATLVPDRRENAPPGAMKEKPGMIVVRVVLQVPAYGIRMEQFGGSDNEDRGDAYKGAVTDALSKCASYLGIGIDVYKGGGKTKANPRGAAVPQPEMVRRPAAPAASQHPNGAAKELQYVDERLRQLEELERRIAAPPRLPENMLQPPEPKPMTAAATAATADPPAPFANYRDARSTAAAAIAEKKITSGDPLKSDWPWAMVSQFKRDLESACSTIPVEEVNAELRRYGFHDTYSLLVALRNNKPLAREKAYEIYTHLCSMSERMGVAS